MKSVTAKKGKQAMVGNDIVRHLSSELDRLRMQISDQAELIEDLKRQASEDPMTNLANRRAFESALDDALCDHGRYGRPGALLVIDVNSFKGINDSLGHLAGDAILKHIASLLKVHTRRSDIVARVGGDEFAIILREAGAGEAELKASEIEAVIAAYPCSYEGHEIHVTVSVGTCTFKEAADRAALIDMADSDMYRNKKEAAENADASRKQV